MLRAIGVADVATNVLTFDLSKPFLMTHKVEVEYGVSFFYGMGTEGLYKGVRQCK